MGRDASGIKLLVSSPNHPDQASKEFDRWSQYTSVLVAIVYDSSWLKTNTERLNGRSWSSNDRAACLEEGKGAPSIRTEWMIRTRKISMYQDCVGRSE